MPNQLIDNLEKVKYTHIRVLILWICNLVSLADLADICLLLCVIDIFSKYAWVVPLKDKKDITIFNTCQKI